MYMVLEGENVAPWPFCRSRVFAFLLTQVTPRVAGALIMESNETGET